MDAADAKQRIREAVWRRLDSEGISTFPRPVRGRIPNVRLADRAAEMLASTPEWARARIVKVNPDAPQRAVRTLGRVPDDVVIATTVHDAQLVEAIPHEAFDVTLDLICTPTGVIRAAKRGARPGGVLWDVLPAERARTCRSWKSSIEDVSALRLLRTG